VSEKGGKPDVGDYSATRATGKKKKLDTGVEKKKKKVREGRDINKSFFGSKTGAKKTRVSQARNTRKKKGSSLWCDAKHCQKVKKITTQHQKKNQHRCTRNNHTKEKGGGRRWAKRAKTRRKHSGKASGQAGEQGGERGAERCGWAPICKAP